MASSSMSWFTVILLSFLSGLFVVSTFFLLLFFFYLGDDVARVTIQSLEPGKVLLLCLGIFGMGFLVSFRWLFLQFVQGRRNKL